MKYLVETSTTDTSWSIWWNNPTLLLIILVVLVIFLIVGYRLIRIGAKSKKTWMVIVGVILTGLIGLVYYLNLREKIKEEESKKQFNELKSEIARLEKKNNEAPKPKAESEAK